MSQILTAHISVSAEPTLVKLETKNYQSKTMHHAELYLDQTTWVVCHCFGFFVFLSFFFWFFSDAYRLHLWTVLYDLYVTQHHSTQ